jgi:hypothetical protein
MTCTDAVDRCSFAAYYREVEEYRREMDTRFATWNEIVGLPAAA